MLFRSSPEKFWNLIARKYAASPIADVEAYQRKLDKLKSYLSPEDSMLDVGCGTGTQCDDFAPDVKHVTGIDISSKLLAIAESRKSERNISNVDFMQATVFDERIKPASFNVVTAFYVLHLCEDLDGVVRRVHDILKPDGLFILETACLGDKSRVVGGVVRFFGKLGLLPLINLLSTQQIENALEAAGFTILEKTKFSDEYTLVARKRR